MGRQRSEGQGLGRGATKACAVMLLVWRERDGEKEIERILNGNSLTSFAYLRQLHI